MKELIINYILSRLQEASTWRGIILLVGGGWARSNPEQVEAIIPITLAIAGAVGAFMPDMTKSVEEVTEETSVGSLPEPKSTPKMPSVVKPKPPILDEDVEPTIGWGDKS